MIRLLLVALFAAGQVCAQNAENVEGDQPLAAMQRATVFNSTEFNPFSFHLGKWPRQIYSGAYAQLRYEANWFDTEAGQGSDTDSRIRLNRARWFVEGLFTDSLYYKLAFDVSDEQDFFLQQAILKFSLPDNSRLWVGKMFYNSLREDWPDPTQTASMDNSAMDYTFGLGTSLGLMWQSNQTDRTRWWLTLNNSDVGSRSPNAEAGETDVTLYGRFDYQIAGTDWSVWDDLIGRRGLPFGVLLGFTAGHMRNGERDSGFEEDTTQLGMDLSVNGDGYQVVLAGTWNNVSATDIIDYYNYGAYFQ